MNNLLTMKQACKATGMSYEALKFYCNEGLVPNVKRAENNYRVFDEHDVNWIRSLACLKRCGMSRQEMKEYLALCLQGQSTIPQRMELLQRYKQISTSAWQSSRTASTSSHGRRIFIAKCLRARRSTTATLSLWTERGLYIFLTEA